MTPEEIISNNILIAEFIGIKGEEQKVYRSLYDEFPNRTLLFKTKFGKYTSKSLKFHSDWNWLMQVVGAIEKTNYGSLEIQSKNLVWAHYNKQTITYYKDTLIKNVYNACVQFVKWYNNHK